MFKLEATFLKQETETAKLSRTNEANQWSADMANLKIQRDKLNKTLIINKKYYFKLLSLAKNVEIKDEIQKTDGRELERKTLETTKRLTEIDRQIKELDIKLKTYQLKMNLDRNLNDINNDYINKSLDLEREQLKKEQERIDRENKALDKSWKDSMKTESEIQKLRNSNN